MKAKIIVAHAGTGKSYCASKYENILDFDHLFYKYMYDEEILKKYSFEQLKGMNLGRKENLLWPQNYIQDLLKYAQQYDVILCPSSHEIIEQLDELGIEYILCYPNLDCKKEYLERYQKRGTNADWIAKMEKEFKKIIEAFEKKSIPKIVLKSNEFLEEKLLEMNLLQNIKKLTEI